MNWQLLVSILLFFEPLIFPASQSDKHPQVDRQLRFNVYTFTVNGADTGRVRPVRVAAYRGATLLTRFDIKTDGAVTDAAVGDLDRNGMPELYLFATSEGSGSFGQVYAWQFLPQRRAAILCPAWRPKTDEYMGRDSIWLADGYLNRTYPIYQSGDAQAEPSGGLRYLRYRLRDAGSYYALEVAARN